MARRFRYAFAKKKEAPGGKLSVGLAIASVAFFLAAVIISYLLDGGYSFLTGGICLFAVLLSVYGFIVGLTSFSSDQYMHRTSMIGSIANGLIMLAWLGFFLMGLR